MKKSILFKVWFEQLLLFSVVLVCLRNVASDVIKPNILLIGKQICFRLLLFNKKHFNFSAYDGRKCY